MPDPPRWAGNFRFLVHPGDSGVSAAGRYFGSDGAFSADGQRFAVCDVQGPTVRTWDTDTGAALAVARPRGRLSGPALTPDGRNDPLVGTRQHVVRGRSTPTPAATSGHSTGMPAG